jgi:hypothetical protein
MSLLEGKQTAVIRILRLCTLVSSSQVKFWMYSLARLYVAVGYKSCVEDLASGYCASSRS